MIRIMHIVSPALHVHLVQRSSGIPWQFSWSSHAIVYTMRDKINQWLIYRAGGWVSQPNAVMLAQRVLFPCIFEQTSNPPAEFNSMSKLLKSAAHQQNGYLIVVAKSTIFMLSCVLSSSQNEPPPLHPQPLGGGTLQLGQCIRGLYYKSDSQHSLPCSHLGPAEKYPQQCLLIL